MFFKKIVSAISALTIAVSSFAGLTLTASAAVPIVYNVTYKTEIEQKVVGEKPNVPAEEYNILKKAGTSYTGNDEKQYVVRSDDTGSADVEVTEDGYKIVYNDAVIYVREAQQYTVTLAAYASDTFLGSIGKVPVWETAESYSYSYPAYVVYNNKLYKKEPIEDNYIETVQEKVSGNTTVNVAYTAEPEYDSAAVITLLEPDGMEVDGASRGGAAKEVTYNFPGQGDYTVIARYKGAVTANCGNKNIDGLTENADGWSEKTAVFSNKSTESGTAFTITAADDDNSYIDYVVLIRTGDAQSTLTYNKSGEGTGVVKVGNTEVSENGQYNATVGTNQTIIVTAGENSYIKSIQGIDGVEWGTNETTRTATITMPSNDITLSVEFGKLYTVNIKGESTTGGAVNLPIKTAKAGDSIVFSAEPDDGYVIGNMSYTYMDGNELKTIPLTGYTFNMPAADVTINVTFNKLRTVSLARAVIKTDNSENTGNPGTISSDGALTVSDPDASLLINAETARGYKFVKFIYVQTEGSIEPLAYYTQEEFELKYSNAEVFDAEASDQEKGMYGAVAGTLTVPDHNVTVIAVFETLKPVTISETPVTGGTLIPTVTEVYPGDTFGVNAVADEGYYDATQLTASYNGIPIEFENGVYTVPYPADEDEYPGEITLSAVFEAIPYNTVETAVSNISSVDYGDLGNDCGTITLSGTGNDNSAYKDAIITVSAIPKDGYEIAAIKITKTNGEEITPSSTETDSVTFIMPDCPVKVTAEFEWVNVLPEDVKADFIEEFTENDASVPASLWTGTLKGRGLAYKPFLSVTVNHNDSTATKTAICNTSITGNSDIFIAVVVDKKQADVKSIVFSGLSDSAQESANQDFDEYKDSQEGEV